MGGGYRREEGSNRGVMSYCGDLRGRRGCSLLNKLFIITKIWLEEGGRGNLRKKKPLSLSNVFESVLGQTGMLPFCGVCVRLPKHCLIQLLCMCVWHNYEVCHSSLFMYKHNHPIMMATDASNDCYMLHFH